jgi:RNA-directed DNA polymerase
MKPILSLRDMAYQLGMPISRLREVARDVESHYDTWGRFDEKNPNIVRQITAPDRELKEIQRHINSRILSRFPLADAVHGGVGGRSPRSNASPHVGQPCVVSLDVKKFFPHVRHYMVHRMFRGEFGFGRDVASLLTRLTTRGSELPQGAPTSTAIANLLLAKNVDGPLSAAANSLGCQYTRFVDDITLSGPDPRPLINKVARNAFEQATADVSRERKVRF